NEILVHLLRAEGFAAEMTPARHSRICAETPAAKPAAPRALARLYSAALAQALPPAPAPEFDDDTAVRVMLEIATETLTGADTPGTVLDRIVALQERIAYLQAEIRRAPDVGALAQDLADAEQQLAHYQMQDQGRN
ncbi:MAG: hypothetical protein WCR20_19965, partial [Verrucomicrobiota bacterium]